jgi:hypothetical protein
MASKLEQVLVGVAEVGEPEVATFHHELRALKHPKH